MPCDTQKNLTPTQKSRMDAAVKRLDAALAAGTVSLVVGATGAIAFKGWQDKEGVADVCAYRKLLSSNSAALRRALASAEARAGRSVDQRAIAAGVHSHDGGDTFHPGH